MRAHQNCHTAFDLVCVASTSQKGRKKGRAKAKGKGKGGGYAPKEEI
jgi:hypothetical protein